MFRGTASRVTVFNPHPPSMKPAGLGGKVVSLLMWAIVDMPCAPYAGPMVSERAVVRLYPYSN